MIDIYVPTFNEQYLLGYFYRFYKQRFPDARFNIVDNHSTDITREVAMSLGFGVRLYNTNGQLDDPSLLAVKNVCYSDSKGWVIVCDMDEWLDITQEQLHQEISYGTTVIRTKGYDMCNVNILTELLDVQHGVYNERFCKKIMFDSSAIESMNWQMGCHEANPSGNVVYSKNVYTLYHMKYWNIGYMLSRYKILNERRSINNVINDYGIQYAMTQEEIKNDYEQMMQKAKIIK